jgi:hypothetical protein
MAEIVVNKEKERNLEILLDTMAMVNQLEFSREKEEMLNYIGLLDFAKNAWKGKIHLYVVKEAILNLKENATSTIINRRMCNLKLSIYKDLYDNVFHLRKIEATIQNPKEQIILYSSVDKKMSRATIVNVAECKSKLAKKLICFLRAALFFHSMVIEALVQLV